MAAGGRSWAKNLLILCFSVEWKWKKMQYTCRNQSCIPAVTRQGDSTQPFHIVWYASSHSLCCCCQQHDVVLHDLMFKNIAIEVAKCALWLCLHISNIIAYVILFFFVYPADEPENFILSCCCFKLISSGEIRLCFLFFLYFECSNFLFFFLNFRWLFLRRFIWDTKMRCYFRVLEE